MKRMVFPVDEVIAVDSRLSGHFGRATFFIVVELDEEGKVVKQETVPKTSEHFGGPGFPPDRILKLKSDAVIALGYGT